MIFVTWEDQRDTYNYGEIYWTIFDTDFNKLIDDEKVNSTGAGAIVDFDTYINISEGPNGPNIVATWEQATDDSWIGHAY